MCTSCETQTGAAAEVLNEGSSKKKFKWCGRCGKLFYTNRNNCIFCESNEPRIVEISPKDFPKQNEARICPHCGVVRPTDEFGCIFCGSEMSDWSPGPEATIWFKKCYACGVFYPLNYNFCGRCHEHQKLYTVELPFANGEIPDEILERTDQYLGQERMKAYRLERAKHELDKTCVSCGKRSYDDWLICSYCGTSLNEQVSDRSSSKETDEDKEIENRSAEG